MNGYQLAQTLRRLKSPNVLVLGDLILDRYTHGDVRRISQEAPIMVLRADQREHRLGGAANVCHMLRGLDAKVSCAGLVGDDEAGSELARLLHAAGVDREFLITAAGRPTTVKERLIGRVGGLRPGQMLRVDHEDCRPLNQTLARSLVRRLNEIIDCFDVIVISDYAKGVCIPTVIKPLIQAARAGRIPVLVDPPRTGGYGHYRGASLLKPNRLEAEQAVRAKLTSPADALAAGRRLCAELDLRMAVITLDQQGMALVHRDGRGQLFSTQAQSIYDVTGAGDMVLAMLAAGIGGGATAEESVQLANVAAGLEVQRLGVAVVEKREIEEELTRQPHAPPGACSHRQIEDLARAYRRQGKRIVFTNGCFDLLHAGHVAYLAEAAALGDVLIVGMNSDASVRRLKGAGRPVIQEVDRAAVLSALSCVDHVVPFEEDTPRRLLQAIRPHVLAKGGTYSVDQVVGKDIVEAYGGQVRVVGLVEGISTTRIIESVTQPPWNSDDAALAAA